MTLDDWEIELFVQLKAPVNNLIDGVKKLTSV